MHVLGASNICVSLIQVAKLNRVASIVGIAQTSAVLASLLLVLIVLLSPVRSSTLAGLLELSSGADANAVLGLTAKSKLRVSVEYIRPAS